MGTGTVMAESTAALAALVTKHKKKLDSIEQQMASIEQELVDLKRHLRSGAQAGSEREPAPVWFGPAAGYRSQLDDLTQWVDGFLRHTYSEYLDDAVHDCWANHPAALWELSTLAAEWRTVYEAEEPSRAGALDWHNRWLPGAWGRLKVVMKGCGSGNGCLHSMGAGAP